MSDSEEYEYEYDDDQDEEMDNAFEYSDEEEEADDGEIQLENEYYNAKGLRETDLGEAAAAFEKVIELDREGGNENGQWSYKALKQLVKLYLRAGDTNEILRHYNRMLTCIAKGNISPNSVEKGVNGMLDRVSSLLQGNSLSKVEDAQKLASQVYECTVKLFDPKGSGSVPNDRLWFKTNLKYGQLLYETNETAKVSKN